MYLYGFYCPGQKPLFTGSGIIIACEDVDGAYVSTILTSGSILKSPAVADDIKVCDKYLSGTVQHLFTLK